MVASAWRSAGTIFLVFAVLPCTAARFSAAGVQSSASLPPMLQAAALTRLRGGAEAGKGDPRWIVTDRPDGANVNAWHWEERDMMMWARERLPELLLAARGEMAGFEGLSGHYAVTNVTSITGDCVIHCRKGKLWPLCDLGLSVKFEGTCGKDGADKKISGQITFPEVTMDDRDDLQVQASTSSRGEESEVFGRWLRKEGYKAVEQALQQFLDALDAKAQEGNKNKPASAQQEEEAEKMRKALAAAEKMAQVNKVMASDVPVPTTVEDDKGPPTGRLELQEEFFAGKLDIYDCLTVPARVNAYSRSSDTEIDRRVGGRFTMFHGRITGGFSELDGSGHLKCKWRMSDWPPGLFSDLRIDVHDRGPSDGCALELIQDGIPKNCVEDVRQHWREMVFNQIKRTFGFGNVVGAGLL